MPDNASTATFFRRCCARQTVPVIDDGIGLTKGWNDCENASLILALDPGERPVRSERVAIVF